MGWVAVEEQIRWWGGSQLRISSTDRFWLEPKSYLKFLVSIWPCVQADSCL
jgi:hypothetical protein